jgi:hypothetical protein
LPACLLSDGADLAIGEQQQQQQQVSIESKVVLNSLSVDRRSDFGMMPMNSCLNDIEREICLFKLNFLAKFQLNAIAIRRKSSQVAAQTIQIFLLSK